MPTKITENHIELLAIQRLESLGYKYLYGSDVAPDGTNPVRFVPKLMSGEVRVEM
jgi:type I restriction enzyme R subunit